MSDRPSPEALLLRAQREERATSGRGTLRIYLGAFPGVGKTYAMLNEGQRRVSYGEDVVVGFVETHGRTATATMLEGLEVVPRRRSDHQGVVVEEMDVDAILRRRPAVALVDELAHTNVTGSERAKRFEDVDVIRDAGINVVSTLNVQHLESLNDTVEALTGVRVRETIPDSVVDEADELILIDLSPQAARARMQHGHIYPKRQAEMALENFFRYENLSQLREIALRRTAQEVDEQLDEYMRESERTEVDEQVLVLIDAAPFSRTLIRRGWRVAQGMRAELIVAYIKRELPERKLAELRRTIELAEDLNARVVAIESETDDTSTLAEFIRRERVNHLVLAHRRRGALARLVQRSVPDRLMLAIPHIDVHLIAE